MSSDGTNRPREQARLLADPNSFEAIAIKWYEHIKGNGSEGYAFDILEYLSMDIFPFIGKRSVNNIKPAEMPPVLRKMGQRGVLDKLKKTCQACRQIFTHAVITGSAENYPVTDLFGALKACKQKHFPYLNLEQVPALFSKVNG